MPNTTRHKLTRERFIEELLRGKGIKAICREYGYKTTSVYYKWKSKYPEFKEQAEKIIASPGHQARIKDTQSSWVEGTSWRESYINKFRETRSRTVAADYAGKTITEIMNFCDPTHDDFDEDFYNMVREEELREAVMVEDELKNKAIIENSVQMQKWIIPFMPVVGEKYYRGAENRLKVKEGDTTNVVFFQTDGLQAGRKLLEDMFGREEITIQ